MAARILIAVRLSTHERDMLDEIRNQLVRNSRSDALRESIRIAHEALFPPHKSMFDFVDVRPRKKKGKV